MHNGRYGPYVKHGKINATIPPSIDPAKITLEEALELLATKTAKSGKATKYGKIAAKVEKRAKPSIAGKAAKPVNAPRKKKPASKGGKRKGG